MIDFYGLPNDFPGKNSLKGTNPFDRVNHIEDEMGRDVDDPRFIPFLTLHEFEALLFTAPEEIVSTFPHWRSARQLLAEAARFSSPEEINEGEDTHPAQRIVRAIPSYRKRIDGPRIIERIGLKSVRASCPHFNQWVEKLEIL